MAKKYTGSLSLEWFNKQKSILVQPKGTATSGRDVPPPRMNWINKDQALFYEIADDEGTGLSPYWVDHNDLRVKEARPLVFHKAYKTVEKQKAGSLIHKDQKLVESREDDSTIKNVLIRGDNLLALNALKKIFDARPEDERIKCIYIDPPYNTGQSFEFYDDGVETSLWLSLLRDRLVVLRQLLRSDGVIFVQIDDGYLAHLRLVMDDVFGANRYINTIALKTKQSSGASGGGEDRRLKKNIEFLLVYGGDQFDSFNDVFNEIELGQYLERMKLDGTSFKYTSVLYELGKKEFVKTIFDGSGNEMKLFRVTNYETRSIARIARDEGLNEQQVIQKYYDAVHTTENAQTSIRTRVKEATDTKDNMYALEYHPISGRNKGKLTELLFVGPQKRLISWFKNVTYRSNDQIIKRDRIGTLWEDLNWNNVTREGGVSFPSGQKPERLVEICLSLATKEGDWILDCFGGSGTTFAVAQKMNRHWVGIEIGKHAETHIIPRLKNVLTGEDQSGISKAVNWQGGGSFKYYTLGDSIINPVTRDFNWKLGRDFIEKSLLSSYDFAPDSEFSLSQVELIKATQHPTMGFHRIGQKQMACVVSLLEPGKDKPIAYDELMTWYEALKNFKGTQSISVFTNRGVELAYDSKPDDLEVIKVPHAIFAELEK